jgi:hypothetical protein
MELKRFQRAALDTLTTYLERARISGDARAGLHRDPAAARAGQDPPALPHHCTGCPVCRMSACACPPAAARRCWPRIPSPWRGGTSSNAITRGVVDGADQHHSRADRRGVEEARPPLPRRARRRLRRARFGVRRVGDCPNPAARPDRARDRHRHTIQSLRTSNTDGRKAYAHSENFEPHFAHIPATTPGP